MDQIGYVQNGFGLGAPHHSQIPSLMCSCRTMGASASVDRREPLEPQQSRDNQLIESVHSIPDTVTAAWDSLNPMREPRGPGVKDYRATGNVTTSLVVLKMTNYGIQTWICFGDERMN